MKIWANASPVVVKEILFRAAYSQRGKYLRQLSTRQQSSTPSKQRKHQSIPHPGPHPLGALLLLH